MYKSALEEGAWCPGEKTFPDKDMSRLDQRPSCFAALDTERSGHLSGTLERAFLLFVSQSEPTASPPLIAWCICSMYIHGT